MNKENIMATNSEQPNVRITRARAKSLATAGGLPPLQPPVTKDQKTVAQLDSKRAQPYSKRDVLEGKNATVGCSALLQSKKRAVLQDVTNLCRKKSNIMGGRVQSGIQAGNGVEERDTKPVPTVVMNPHVQQAKEATLTKARAQEVQKVNNLAVQGHGSAHLMAAKQASGIQAQSGRPARTSEMGQPGQEVALSDGLHVADIDSNHKDPQMCGIYAPTIYEYQRVSELVGRPSSLYIEMLQRDITHVMRGILMDWLVEVADEYMLAPDTLYLTVYLIDRFLSKYYIERKKLQLVGVTCMLIASKYEEICAPTVEDFCIITDNTYRKNEVLLMEKQVLNFVEFQLSGPTIKKFLRRFIQASQSCYEAPRVELECLANYLAELTLPEYGFLEFLPSLIAASAVFLARWMLDQSNQPWNPTLEHYTNYKVSALKPIVFQLQKLHLNTNSSLKAVREKYMQPKFKSVAKLSSPELVESAFQT
ncbi:hypothetical protein AgCh_022467 [Apium graveolens]